MKIHPEQVNLLELKKMREMSGYLFTKYDSGFKYQYGKDAWCFMCCGRDMLFSTASMIDDRLLLAKAQSNDGAVLFYVDRDYYELSFRDFSGLRHLYSWQTASIFRGFTMEDLEYTMAQFLFDKGASLSYQPKPIKKRIVRFWEEGEDPPAIQALEQPVYDPLI